MNIGSALRPVEMVRDTFYHKADWIDFNGDGVKDLLTARVRATQMDWLHIIPISPGFFLRNSCFKMSQIMSVIRLARYRCFLDCSVWMAIEIVGQVIQCYLMLFDVICFFLPRLRVCWQMCELFSMVSSWGFICLDFRIRPKQTNRELSSKGFWCTVAGLRLVFASYRVWRVVVHSFQRLCDYPELIKFYRVSPRAPFQAARRRGGGDQGRILQEEHHRPPALAWGAIRWARRRPKFSQIFIEVRDVQRTRWNIVMITYKTFSKTSTSIEKCLQHFNVRTCFRHPDILRKWWSWH